MSIRRFLAAAASRPVHSRLKSGLRLATLGSLLFVGSCAEQRDPINRVQANALEKKFFVGALDTDADDPEFFSRNFVVDASKSQHLVGLSTASGLERIRWQITEDMLFARRAYAVTSGDDKGTALEPNGDILAAYKVQEHFDVRRAYNSSTGEELNVIDENSSDRPWHQREFFRVDWSENLVNSPSWTSMFYGQVFGDIKLTPVSYFESDPSSPDAPHFEAEEGYFDITSHFFVEPENVDLGYFELPMCMLMGIFTGSAIYSCDPQEAVVRSSYWRVSEADRDNDFEPFENTRAPLDIFGNPGGIGNSASLGVLTPPRDEYDPQYGYTDHGLRRYMNIHNLWQQSHQARGECKTNADCRELTDNDGSVCLDSGSCSLSCNYEFRADVDQNGTDDQCENSITRYKGAEGSQCSARNRCTLPYRDRETKTLTYFVNPEMPDALQDTVSSKGKVTERGPTEQLVETWSQALEVAVARAREVECRRTTAGDPELTRTQCHDLYFETANGADVAQMVHYGGWGLETPKALEEPLLVTCHNPVRSYDHPACGQEGYSARVGDLRRNFMIYWPFNTEAPYGGIGNWRGDPVTGQIIGSAATTIGPSTTRSAAQVRDVALVALGELDLADITDGVSAALFEKRLREGRAPTALTIEEINKRLASVDSQHLGQQTSFDLSEFQSGDPREVMALLKSSLTTNQQLETQQLLELEARSEPLLNTEFETRLLNPNWLVDATGLSPNTQLSQAVLSLASPLRGQDMGRLASMDRHFMTQLGQRGICMFDAQNNVGNPDLYGIGHYYRAKYPELQGAAFADQIYEDVWRETYKGIQLHELGHSLGLLHNFTSSYDATNYNPQYWQLRTHNGQSSASCGGMPRVGDTSSAAGDTCMGPRYLDPETTDELGLGPEPRPAIDYYAHTSSMEYQGTRFFESVGLGQYDVMAIGALYGRVLQTFDARLLPQNVQANYEPLHRTQLDESSLALTGNNMSGKHYTQLARELQLFDPARCRPATSEEQVAAEWRVVGGQVCMPPPKDYGHWDDFVDTADPTLSKRQDLTAPRMRILAGRPVPGSGNVRWPYRFGGDIMNSYLHVNPFDVGADPYEVTMETIAQNEYGYPFNYFRRDRRGWTQMRLPATTARNFYERLRSYHWGVSYTNAAYDEISQAFPLFAGTIEALRNDDNELRPFLIAQSEMFRAITETFLVPEPGAYTDVPESASGVYDLIQFGGDSGFGLDASGGRYISPSFDSSAAGGGSWLYDDYVNRAGFSVEKTLASRALTDGRPVFFSTGRDIYLDSRNLNINFRSDFPTGVDRLLGGVLAEDWETIAPYVVNTTDPVVLTRDFASPSPDPLPQGARSLFPNIGYNQQVPTIIYAYLFGRSNGDLTLSNKLRVWVEGSVSGELDIPEAEQVRFTNPESGITYVARKFGPETVLGKEVDRGIGSRMLQRANALLSSTYQVQTDEVGVAVSDDFGRPTLLRTEDGELVLTEDSTALSQLRRYVGLLDANVQISTLIGHGPFN